MASATFHFGLESQYKCEVITTPFGSEKYFVYEKLVLKHWSLSINGVREFETMGHKVRVEMSTTSAKAFVDGALVVEDIYSEYKENIKKRLSESTFFYIAIRLLIWIVVAFIIALIANVIRAAI